MEKEIESHNENYERREKFGMGDSYGVGFPPKVGKLKSSIQGEVPPESKVYEKPPRTIK